MKNSEVKKAVITQETMSAVGKEAELAGKKYLIAPISIADMHLVINNVLFLPILDKENVEDIYYALNVTDEEKSKVFFEIVEKYCKYNNGKVAVTKELVEEHNWSFKDIKQFLKVWLQISD